MKRSVFLSLFFVAITVTSAFSKDRPEVRETRDLSGFSKVSFGVAGELYISIGSEFKVELEGDKSVLEDIVTEVTNERLVIKKENWRLNLNERIIVYVTMPELKGLGVSGSGRAEIKDPVKADVLDLSVSGSGKIYTTDITASGLKCGISGSGDIIFDGNSSAKRADISISGSGNYSGESMKIESAEVSISGSGSCTCYVTDSLGAHVSGSGNVTYSGDPKIDARVSGSGHVRSR
jgi:hypothetical protein